MGRWETGQNVLCSVAREEDRVGQSLGRHHGERVGAEVQEEVVLRVVVEREGG